VRVLNVFRRINRAVARFNDWFAPAAMATHIGGGGADTVPTQSADPASVVAAIGEIETRSTPRPPRPL
jgi:hypothetical protein